MNATYNLQGLIRCAIALCDSAEINNAQHVRQALCAAMQASGKTLEDKVLELREDVASYLASEIPLEYHTNELDQLVATVLE